MWDLKEYLNMFNAIRVPQGFSYNSENNSEWETVEGLRRLIKEHVDISFKL